MVMDIFLIALGLGAIAIAMFAKSYYWGRGMGEGPLSKPAPRWFGQLAFVVAGVLCLAVGFLDLFGVRRHVN
jgi:hypothetical protein